LSKATLEVLAERRYNYDATTFPTYIGPLARAYYFRHARHLTEEQRQERMIMYGTWRDGRQPVSPYYWKLERGALLEIPVTTMPAIKLPFHFSYLLYIATYSKGLSMMYLRSALRFCRALGIGPSMLLHPLDFVGSDDIDELGFFPAMNLLSSQKLDVMLSALTILQRHQTVVAVGEHADLLRRSTNLVHRTPPEISQEAGGRTPVQASE
jgi:hypothetical protein